MRVVGLVLALLLAAPAFAQELFRPTSSTTQRIGGFVYTDYSTPQGTVHATQWRNGQFTYVDYRTPQGDVHATFQTIGGITHGDYRYSHGYGRNDKCESRRTYGYVDRWYLSRGLTPE